MYSRFVESVFPDITLKNNTEVANSKCYAFASSTLLSYFLLQTLKMMINIWPYLKFVL